MLAKEKGREKERGARRAQMETGKPKKLISVSHKESQWFWFRDIIWIRFWLSESEKKILSTILKNKFQFSIIFKMKKTGKLKEKHERE